ESDWLRFDLILWRCTGDSRYLDVAQRLLQNEYLANQTPDGGYGMRYYDDNETGPIGTYGAVNEWYFCCNFAGPLGLYFLKSYLATASSHNIYINFPFAFSSLVKVNNEGWKVTVNRGPQYNDQGEEKLTITVTPQGTTATHSIAVLFRIPGGTTVGGHDPQVMKDGYLVLSADCAGTHTFSVMLKPELRIESRRFAKINVTPDRICHLQNVSLVWGSKLLYQLPARSGSASTLLAVTNGKGQIRLLQKTDSGFASVILPALNLSREQIRTDVLSGQKVSLTTWSFHTTNRTAFVYNMIVVPEKMLPSALLNDFDKKEIGSSVVHFGSDLQDNQDLWPSFLHWNFTPKG
ncbi:MAG: hypothetical protein ACREHG_06765, partial [Candidatus Saccharimonadales bacterium]